VPFACQVIVYHAQHDLAAQLRLALLQVIPTHPQGAQYAGVQGSLRVLFYRFGHKAGTNVADALCGGVMVKAQHTGKADVPGCFFQSLAQRAFLQAFMGFQMSGGLVVEYAAFDHFFDNQEKAVTLDDGRDGAVRVPLTHVWRLSAGFRRRRNATRKCVALRCRIASARWTIRG